MIEKVSDAGSAQAKKAIMDLNEEQNSVLPIIEQRHQILVSISQLSADIATLRVLLRSVQALVTNASSLCTMLHRITSSVTDHIGEWFRLELILEKENTPEILLLLDEFKSAWDHLTSGADILQQFVNFNVSSDTKRFDTP